MYNLTALTESESLLEIVVYLNNSTEQIFFHFLMVAIFFLFTLTFYTYPLEKRILAASWISFTLSTFLTFAGLVNFLMPLAFLVISAFSGLYIYKK